MQPVFGAKASPLVILHAHLPSHLQAFLTPSYNHRCRGCTQRVPGCPRSPQSQRNRGRGCRIVRWCRGAAVRPTPPARRRRHQPSWRRGRGAGRRRRANLMDQDNESAPEDAVLARFLPAVSFGVCLVFARPSWWCLGRGLRNEHYVFS